MPLGQALGRQTEELVEAVVAATDERARVDLLRVWLVDLLRDLDPKRVATAREVAAVARLAEVDRTIRRVEELASVAGVTMRTLQRLFAEYVGASPRWVLRRYRILDAAEQARGGPDVAWAELAADLGYADQAHLVRDFRAHLGTTPAAYAVRQAVVSRVGPQE
jgi:AraC-like DNA-binding protein